MASIGKQSEWFCENHPLRFGYGPGTSIGRLVDSAGSLLSLGSDLNHIALLYYVEHCAQLPQKRIAKRLDKVLSQGVVKEVEIEEFDTEQPVVSSMPEDYFADITQRFVSES